MQKALLYVIENHSHGFGLEWITLLNKKWDFARRYAGISTFGS